MRDTEKRDTRGTYIDKETWEKQTRLKLKLDELTLNPDQAPSLQTYLLCQAQKLEEL